MDSVNFRGAFLIKKPKCDVNNNFVKAWNSIQAELPKKKCVFPQFNKRGDKLFVVKSVYDRAMASIILNCNVRFKFYPDINLKNRLDSDFPEEAKKVLDAQKNVISTKEDLRNYVQIHKEKPIVLSKYRWKPDDHVDKTYRALGLNKDEYHTKIVSGITLIKDKNGKIVAKASPNNERGVNFIYVYPTNWNDFSSRRLALSQNGDTYEFGPLEIVNFQKQFIKNVKIDLGRKRPKNAKNIY